jgi:hypothetical protein
MKKNNLGDFIKWNTHIPFFKNAPWDFMLCKHTSKYTIKNLRGKTSRVAPSPGVLHDVKLATFFIIILPGTRQASWGKK